jgi:cobyrinic acid a,c-diamide synthase
MAATPPARGRGLILAAPASGSGKTVLTMALLRLLANSGRNVAAIKTGPDYIDPAFHGAASGRPCVNLDLWAMRRGTVAALIERLSRDHELIVAEGAMGLFDGAADGSGATADLAALTGWPVLLVVDARGQGASVAALVQGFRDHRTDVQVSGVICNRVGSEDHAAILARALEPLGLPLLGMVRRDAGLALPERHLGLVQAAEHDDLDGFIEHAAGEIGQQIDTARLVETARAARDLTAQIDSDNFIAPLGQHIAIAQDEAFAFAYPALLQQWRERGATLSFFSPLAGEGPISAADAIYLPGGYPELHADRLARNETLMTGLEVAARRGAVIYGECGGYMLLGGGVVDETGRRHKMAGLLALETSFAERKLYLGYRAVTLRDDTLPLGGRGTGFRGHEFHYARILSEAGAGALFEASDSRGRALGPSGQRVGRVFGSFVHLIDRAA